MVGLLPAEEAAIRKALRESLRTAAAEKSRDESSSSSSDSTPSPSPKEQHIGSKRRSEANSQSLPPAKRTKLKKQKGKNLSLASFNGGSGNKGQAEVLSCQSPAKLSVPSSPECEHSSPVISESGSLKLILSSDSSSSSSSPCSSHQDSTSKRKPAKKTSNKSSKVKRVLLAEFSAPAGQKAKHIKEGGSKSTTKQKKKSEGRFISNGTAKLKTGKKNQRALHQDSKDKAAKSKRTTPGKKEQKKVPMVVDDKLSIGRGLSSTLTSVNFPDIQDDGAAEMVTGDAGSPTRAECDDSKEEREDKQEQQKTATFTWYEIR